jgi:MFS-type transporter involved in bile tolerance (Atg22 family)
MYETAPPVGVVAGTVLATTGADSLGITIIAISLLIGGLLLLRIHATKKRRAQHTTK